MKRLFAFAATAALAFTIAAVAGARTTAVPTMTPGTLVIGFGDPAVNFAISQRGAKPGVDHVGIQVETDEELAEMNARFAAADMPVQEQTGASCCYAKSDKAWTVDPQGNIIRS